ncbi:hypothetical protein FACS189481_3810 [Clostridia bacterium]|nr:hypothetical protein FACS189481_3810 [Clostridia bacterium]
MFAMKIFVRTAKSVLVLSLILSAEVTCHACFFRNTDYVASYGGKTISSEVYKQLQYPAGRLLQQEMLKTNEARWHQVVAISQGSSEKFLGEVVNGKTVESMLAEFAKDEVCRFAAVDAIFVKDNLKLLKKGQEELDQLKKQMEDDGKAATDAKTKGKQTAREVQKAAEKKKQREAHLELKKNDLEREAVFDFWYSKTSDDELKKYFNSSYIKICLFQFPYAVDGEETKEVVQKQVEKFLKDVESLGFGKAAVKEVTQREAKSGQKSETKETEEEKIKRVAPVLFTPKEKLGADPFSKAVEKAPLNKATLFDFDAGHAFVVFEVLEKTDEDFKNEKEKGLLHVFKNDEFNAKLLAYGKTLRLKFNNAALAEFRPRNMESSSGV